MFCINSPTVRSLTFEERFLSLLQLDGLHRINLNLNWALLFGFVGPRPAHGPLGGDISPFLFWKVEHYFNLIIIIHDIVPKRILLSPFMAA